MGTITSTIEKDPTVFPAFTSTIAGLMQQETQTFLDDVVWNENGSLDTFFTAPYTFVNGPLAQYYGISGVTGNAFVKTPVNVTQRAGLLTQGGIVSQQAKTNQTSPVLRGKYVREQLHLCQQLPPPPPNIQIKPPDLSSTLTTRQRFTQHSANAACSVCHHLMDPLGLGFENFDGAGIYRTMENGQPIDSSGQVDNVDTELQGPFNGVLQLEQKLGGSSTVQQCVTTQWFRSAYGRSETDADACSMAGLSGPVRARAATRCRICWRPSRKPRRSFIDGATPASAAGRLTMKPFRLSRRALLRGAGGIAIGLPFLEIMTPRGRASAAGLGAPKRYINFFSPNGTIYPAWVPTAGTSPTDFTLSRILAPLAP